jgi:glycosyltransferase involved in cell wall biosynthesis
MKKVVFIDVDGFALAQFRSPLLRRLTQEGVEVIACSGEFRSTDRDKLEAIGCRVESIPLQRTGIDPGADRTTRRRLRDFLTDENPDTIVARAAKAVAYALPEAERIGIERRIGFMTGLGTMFHPGTAREKLLGLIGRKLILRGLRSANRIWVLNQDDERTLRRMGANTGPVEIECMDSDGIDTGEFSESDPPGIPTFCFIGRLLPAKGARLFLEAAEKIRRTRSDIEFLVAGSPDDHRGTVTTEELHALEGDHVIRYEGFVDDLQELMSRISCLVLPSFHEGRPRTIIEALSSGRPVIVSDAVGCRDAIQDGSEGLVVPRGDSTKLAEAITDLADDPVRMRTMGRRARMTAVERYGEAAVVERYIRSMRNL